MKQLGLLLIILFLLPSVASAWWNEEWGYKKKISLDVQKLKQDNITLSSDIFVLIRLHTGNFGYFADLAAKGKDIRLLASDETTPLKFYIEKLDVVNEMALIWVKLPKDIAASPDPTLWIYYGNPQAVDGQDLPGSFGVNEVLAYDFNQNPVKDLTANANHPSLTTATITDAGLIAGAAVFSGGQSVHIPATPSLQMAPSTGWTLATWVKIDQAQQNTVLLQRTNDTLNITLAVREETPYLEVNDGITQQEFAGLTPITKGSWHHLAVVATASNLTLYVDGVTAGTFAVTQPEWLGDINIGADAGNMRGFIGQLDQLVLTKAVRDANAIKFDVKMQTATSNLITYGDDSTPDSEEGEESYFIATLNNVTLDGWIIIGILAVMGLISWMVIVVKTIVLNRVHRKNIAFEQAFSHLSAQDIAALDEKEVEGDEDFDESPLLFSLSNNSGTFAGSPIYHIYHVGVDEMNKRFSKDASTSQILSASSMAAVKASMDAVVIRELQKLNSQMVLLTIAISGGPFLGLLGTVVGVMITFASIAASGEINVNAIAPGIAAALVATVAGLAVAIPALFGYNYLGSRIKIVSADMQVFVDEFVAKLTEQHT